MKNLKNMQIQCGQTATEELYNETLQNFDALYSDLGFNSKNVKYAFNFTDGGYGYVTDKDGNLYSKDRKWVLDESLDVTQYINQ